MAFAGGTGLDIELSALGADPRQALFSEELGAVIQIRRSDEDAVLSILRSCGLESGPGKPANLIGSPRPDDHIEFRLDGRVVLTHSRADWRRVWAETTHVLQSLRDNPDCASEQYETASDAEDPGLSPRLTFDPEENLVGPWLAHHGAVSERPKVAILREQGVNSQVEMAAAFHCAGFASVDLHMTDLLSGRVTLDGFRGLVGCGGFSYGDVLGAGQGWAKSILFSTAGREAFGRFFKREDTFSLGVCNGCQMFAALKELISGAEHFPSFVRNRSEQFEGRLCMVQVESSPSVLMKGMAGSHLPIAVAHGEGQAEFATPGDREALERAQCVCARYVDTRGRVTERYPFNPNGSPSGITAVCTPDGRVTLMMPHPERVFRTAQYSWHPADWGSHGPWLRLFQNARLWVN